MFKGATSTPLWFGCLLLTCCGPGVSAALPDYSAERVRYAQAMSALGRGEQSRFDRLNKSLADYPLQPYLHYADLKRRLKGADPKEVRGFLSGYADSPIATRLRGQWLRQLGKQRRWTDYLLDYTPRSASDLRCYWHRARLQRGHRADYGATTRDLWLTGKSQHDACDPLFEHWRSSGQLSEQAYSERAELAVKAGNSRMARYLSRDLPKWRRAEIQRWVDVRSKPAAMFKQAKGWRDTEFHRKLFAHEFTRRAKRDNEFATRQWQTLKDHFTWDDEQRAAIESSLALYYATDHPPDALSRLQALTGNARNQQILEWTIRIAVRDANWQAVEDTWQQLPSADQSKPRWQYWRGRAQAGLGDTGKAEGIFRDLARETNFYGFLSADRLNQPYVICPAATPRNPDSLLEHAGMVRAFELFFVGELGNARREWNFALRGLDTPQRVQAALLADQKGWYNRAILTLADEGRLKEYDARFPLAWQPTFLDRAVKESLDFSLLIAVARSESALMTDAVSSAGARGLMQLTPATGRRVAKAHRWRRPNNWDLLQPKTNIRLGSAYLDQLFDRFHHPVQVLAAYNAGPHVVDRWENMNLPSEPDRWIESLPYYETRDYISRVLAFATIYDWRRTGTMQRLSARMLPLTGKPARFTPTSSSGVAPVCSRPAVVGTGS